MYAMNGKDIGRFAAQDGVGRFVLNHKDSNQCGGRLPATGVGDRNGATGSPWSFPHQNSSISPSRSFSSSSPLSTSASYCRAPFRPFRFT